MTVRCIHGVPFHECSPPLLIIARSHVCASAVTGPWRLSPFVLEAIARVTAIFLVPTPGNNFSGILHFEAELRILYRARAPITIYTDPIRFDGKSLAGPFPSGETELIIAIVSMSSGDCDAISGVIIFIAAVVIIIEEARRTG